MIINRTKSVFDNFIALIKESNPSFEDVTEDQVILGLPVADNSVQGRNTRIEITAKAHSGYSGTRTLYYSRCSLSELIEEAWIPEIINLEVFDTGADVVDMILLNMGSMANQIVINEGDSVVLPDFLSSGDVSVRSVTNSIIFADEEIDVAVINDLTGEFFDYRYEDWAGSTVVFNYAPNQIHGTRIGNQPTTIPGIVGNAWNPGNPACAIDTGQKLPGGALSFTTRVRMWSVNGQQYIVGNADASGNNSSAGVLFGFLNANFVITVGNGVSVWQDSTIPHGISVGQIVDIGFSISKTGLIKIYKNGSLMGTKQAGVERITTSSYNNVYVGQAGEYGFKFGNNFVDRTRMWNRELSEAEFALVQNVLPLKNSKWNALDKGASVTLEDNDRIAKCSNSNSVRGTVGRRAGKRMFEVTVTGGDDRLLIGAGRINALLSSYPGRESVSFGYFAYNGNFLNGSTNGVAYGQSYGAVDVIGVGIDFDNNQFEFFKNGVSQGIGSVDLDGEYYFPMIGSATTDSIQQTGILNVGEEGFAFPQEGYDPWYYDLEITDRILATVNDPIMVDLSDDVAAIKNHIAARLGIPSNSFVLGNNADDVFTLVENDAGPLKITTVSENIWFNGVSNGVANITIGRNISQYRVILGSWTEIPVKSSTRATRVGYGPVGQTNNIDLGSEHIPAAGTVVGEKIFDSGGNLLSFFQNDLGIYLSFDDLVNNHNNKTFRFTNVTRNTTLELLATRIAQNQVYTNPNAAFYSFSLTTPNIFMTYVGDVIDITIL